MDTHNDRWIHGWLSRHYAEGRKPVSKVTHCMIPCMRFLQDRALGKNRSVGAKGWGRGTAPGRLGEYRKALCPDGGGSYVHQDCVKIH